MLLIKLAIFALTVINLSIHAEIIKENHSSHWMKSIEYNFLCQQVFQNAKNRINEINLSHAHSEILEAETKANLPLAVITDIDETILLNYDFQIEKQDNFSYELFEKYINNKTATPIEGSIKYFQYLASKGIKIIYISNRHASSEDKTFEYLQELGYPIKDKNDLLLKNEIPEWKTDKSTRRAYIGKRYTVIQVFGDSIKDFASNEVLILKNQDKFGLSWFLLPNPLYGTWLKN